jgi:hypothetical protein
MLHALMRSGKQAQPLSGREAYLFTTKKKPPNLAYRWFSIFDLL